MRLLKWFIQHKRHGGIAIGSTINHHTFGKGTVTGGSVCIRYDKAPRSRHPNDRSWTHNLEELENF